MELNALERFQQLFDSIAEQASPQTKLLPAKVNWWTDFLFDTIRRERVPVAQVPSLINAMPGLFAGFFNRVGHFEERGQWIEYSDCVAKAGRIIEDNAIVELPQRPAAGFTAPDPTAGLSTGQQIDYWREKARLSIEKLAEEVALSVKSVKNHIADKFKPTLANIAEYERVFREAIGDQSITIRR